MTSTQNSFEVALDEYGGGGGGGGLQYLDSYVMAGGIVDIPLSTIPGGFPTQVVIYINNLNDDGGSQQVRVILGNGDSFIPTCEISIPNFPGDVKIEALKFGVTGYFVQGEAGIRAGVFGTLDPPPTTLSLEPGIGALDFTGGTAHVYYQ